MSALPSSFAALPSVAHHDGARSARAAHGRPILRRAFVGAVGLSLLSLDLLSTKRRAYAGHVGSDGYQIKALPCPDYAGDHNCNPGCGPSHVCGGGGSGPCCHPPADHKVDWHKDGPSCSYRLRKDACAPGGWDGWRWAFSGSCGCCGGGLTYRCHDGKRFNPDNCAFVQNTICRATVTCDPPFTC